MSAPYEILAGPVEVYLAAANTAMPAVNSTPGGSWTLLGTSGSSNYNEDGVSVMPEQSLEVFRALGTTGARKVWRTEEELKIEFTVHDLTLEVFRKALNDNAITTTAAGVGTAGRKTMNMVRGQSVALHAVLLRSTGQSPYNDGMNAQFWMPVGYQEDAQEIVFAKGEPAGVKFTFAALQDATNGFGVYDAQTAAPL